MRIFIIIILSIIVIGLFVQLFILYREKSQLQNKFENLSAKAAELKDENDHFGAEIKYFSMPQNLEKELREKFNYKKPDEKMIIVTP